MNRMEITFLTTVRKLRLVLRCRTALRPTVHKLHNFLFDFGISGGKIRGSVKNMVSQKYEFLSRKIIAYAKRLRIPVCVEFTTTKK